VTGATLEEQDRNLKALLDAEVSDMLTFNEEKSKIGLQQIDFLGYRVSHNVMKPDPERHRPLLDMPPPRTPPELKRVSGMFAYYSKWIENFSFKAGPLLKQELFRWMKTHLKSFDALKTRLLRASVGSIRDDLAFKAESDASDYAIASVLSQGGRRVTFMSRTLNKCEKSLSHYRERSHCHR